jgi:hypothetical protein
LTNADHPADDLGFPPIEWFGNVSLETHQVAADFAALQKRLRAATGAEHRWHILAEKYPALVRFADLVSDLATVVHDSAPAHVQVLMNALLAESQDEKP